MSAYKCKARWSAVKPVSSMEMSVEDWINVPSHPHQRKEELRVNRPHLRDLKLPHWVVFMAIIKDGKGFREFKIDGHTRALKWSRKTLDKPPFLIVVVISARSIEEAQAVYQCYDSILAAKAASDYMQSGQRAYDFQLKNHWLMAGKFSAMLSEACIFAGIDLKKTSHIDRVGKFKEELKALDTIKNQKKQAPPMGFGAAFLLALRKHAKDPVNKAKVLEFIQAFNDGGGKAEGNERCPVKFALDLLWADRAAKSMAGKANNHRQMGFTLGCIERYLEAGPKLRKRAPNVVNLSTYLPKDEETKRRGRSPKMDPKAIAAGVYPSL